MAAVLGLWLGSTPSALAQVNCELCCDAYCGPTPPPPPLCTVAPNLAQCLPPHSDAPNQLVGGFIAGLQQQSFGDIQGILQGLRDGLQGPGGPSFPNNGITGSFPTGGPPGRTGQIGQNFPNNPTPGGGPPFNPSQTFTPGAPGPGGQPFNPGPPAGTGPPPGAGLDRNFSERSFSGAPSLGENRFVPNQVLIQVVNTVTADRVLQLAQQLGLTLIRSQVFAASNRTLYLFSFPPGGNIRTIIIALERNQVVASAGPNYIFLGAQNAAPNAQSSPPQPPPAAPASPAVPAAPSAPTAVPSTRSLPSGDAAQYSIEMLHLLAAHQLSTGRNVPVALIDSEVDGQNPDLLGAIKESFDTTATPSNPQSHGTGMAGAIGARTRLLGIAPGATIIAIKAFTEGPGGVNGTGEQILRGLDHAIAQAVRVVNMSFAGPRDLMLERTIAAAYEKNITIVAAAGNGGPRSPPLFPGADPHVIAVTAVDSADMPFAGANRGKYIALAAPGVDVLVPEIGGGVHFTTGTSVAAANVTGVVALLLERGPNLTPAQIRSILTRTAKKILPNDKAFQTGAGLVDPLAALQNLSGTAELIGLGPVLAYAPVPANRDPWHAPYYKSPQVAPVPAWAGWARGFGDWEKRGALDANDVARSQDAFGMQAGFDRVWQQLVTSGDYFITGVFGSYMSSRATFASLQSTVHLEGPGVGAYAMWINGGFSTDVTARTDFFNLAEDFAGTPPNPAFRVTAPAVAENIQYKFWLGGPAFLEPTAGYMYSRALFDGAAVASGLQDGTTLRVQGGARLGTMFDLIGVRVVPTLTGLVYEDAIQQGTAVSTSPTAPAGIVLPLAPTDQGLVRGEVIPQLDIYFADGLAAFLQGGVRFGREMVGATAKVGLAKTW